MLNIESIKKDYAGKTALKTVDLDLQSNESFGLIGLNGAGKTTLIKCILDLHQATSGEIHIGGKSSRQYLARQQLVYLPEKFSPPDYMTGLLYLQFINDAHRLPRLSQQKLQETAEQLCSDLELPADVLSQSVRNYSKGMLQKLGLIGCMLSDKALLILDEPMSGLDPKSRVLFRQAMKRLKEGGKTILFCTHILNDIELLCDRVGILHQGQLLFIGAPDDYCQKYQANNLEAAFLACLEQFKPI